MSEQLSDLLLSTEEPRVSKKRPTWHYHKFKHTEETRSKLSFAARNRTPEQRRAIASRMGKVKKNLTPEERERRKQQLKINSAGSQSKAGKTMMLNPENRRKFMRKCKWCRNLTDEEFEEKMKEMDKKYEELARQQTSSD